MIDRRIFKNIDWIILFLILLITLIGIINLYSATYPVRNSHGTPLFLKQIYWLMVGFVLMVITVLIDYHVLERLAYPIYWVSVISLVLVLFLGKEISGSHRWLQLGPISFQPSELAKFVLIIALAKYFHQDENPDGYMLRELVLPFMIIAVPFVMILVEPDLGTSSLFILVGFVILLFLKVNLSSLLILAGALVASSPFFWYFLKDYQKNRILTLFKPSLDPLGAGYHIIQSKIAVGSGGLFGKGFLEGTQSQLRFLPEQHTDFVFSVIAEEWGFIGSGMVLILFIFLLLRGLSIAMNARDKLGTLLAFGVVTMFFWHVIINVGMVIGIFPVVGAPLPFVSYGGSSLITNMIAVGLLLNITMRRYIF